MEIRGRIDEDLLDAFTCQDRREVEKVAPQETAKIAELEQMRTIDLSESPMLMFQVKMRSVEAL